METAKVSSVPEGLDNVNVMDVGRPTVTLPKTRRNRIHHVVSIRCYREVLHGRYLEQLDRHRESGYGILNHHVSAVQQAPT